uniref:EGF-like domain-containing protein n=1 Tax=Glossina austeni TaxID=7395 RepID=A0A1A9VXE9_GLOAU
MQYERPLSVFFLCEVLLFMFSFHGVLISAHNVSITNNKKNCTSLEITFATVKKTRIVSAPVNNVFSKLFKKTTTKLETYLDEEPVTKEVCCKGYKWQSQTDLCQPVCAHNCPEHSICVEPNFCECKEGYYSALTKPEGRHYCQPICKEPCSPHSICFKPNECVCQKGYQMAKSQHIKICEPICDIDCPPKSICKAPNECICEPGYFINTTDWLCKPYCKSQCPQGICVAPGQCACEKGYKALKGTCTLECDSEQCSDTLTSAEIEDKIDSSYPDVDIEYSTQVTIETDSTDDFSEEPIHKCSQDYVYYRGQCRPLKFSSTDCRVEPCSDINAVCLENGTCECREGYMLLTSFQEIDSNKCITLKDYEFHLQSLNDDDSRGDTFETSYSWILLATAAVAITVALGSLIALLVRVIRKPRGHLNIEAKNLSCVYDNKACIETPKTNI